jgi:Ca2+-binding EF-hand superfamily protein
VRNGIACFKRPILYIALFIHGSTFNPPPPLLACRLQVDALELAEGLHLLGVSLTPLQVAAFIADLDTDGNSTLSLKEFQAALHARRLSAHATARREMVATFDAVELKAFDAAAEAAWAAIVASPAIGAALRNKANWRSEVAALFDSFDTDHSGEVDIAELESALRHLGVRMTGRQLVGLPFSSHRGSLSFLHIIVPLRSPLPPPTSTLHPQSSPTSLVF